MNERLTELYRSCRSKEALASQDQFGSANALLGSEVEKFAELIVRECADFLDTFNKEHMVEEGIGGAELKEHFGVKE